MHFLWTVRCHSMSLFRSVIIYDFTERRWRVTACSLLFRYRTFAAKDFNCAFNVRIRHVGSDIENSGMSIDNGNYRVDRHGDLIEAGTLYIRGASFMNSKYNRKLVSPVTLPGQKLQVITYAQHAFESAAHLQTRWDERCTSRRSYCFKFFELLVRIPKLIYRRRSTPRKYINSRF